MRMAECTAAPCNDKVDGCTLFAAAAAAAMSLAKSLHPQTQPHFICTDLSAPATLDLVKRPTSLHYVTLPLSRDTVQASHSCLSIIIVVKMTSLGPLTTVFTVPSTCASVITSNSGNLFFGHFATVDLRCYPPGASSLTTQWFSSYYWSPGVCPWSWTTACIYTEIQFAAAETASLCCPL
jgi:hypothetical protein